MPAVPWSDVLHQHRAGRRAVALPQFRAGVTVVGSERTRTPLTPVRYEGEGGAGAAVDIPDEHRAFRRAVALPKLLTQGAVIRPEKKQDAVQVDKLIGTRAIASRINVFDPGRAGGACRSFSHSSKLVLPSLAAKKQCAVDIRRIRNWREDSERPVPGLMSRGRRKCRPRSRLIATVQNRARRHWR